MGRNHLEENKQEFSGGATRSKSEFRFDLIPPQASRALARRLALGASKHGQSNWKKGGAEFIQATINHLEDHIAKLKQSGQRDDDNIGAILCNAAFLAWYFEVKPEDFENALTECR